MPVNARSSATAYRLVPLALLIVAALLFLVLGGRRYLSLTALADNKDWLCETVARSGATGVFAFVLAYAGFVSLSIPGAAFLTIAGGLLFGPWLGTLYAVVGATIGATVVFLAARIGLAGLALRAGPLARRLAIGFRRHGFNYLVMARLIPIFPFWLVNLVAGALDLPVGQYVLGTLLGIVPVTFIYASLGNGFGTVVEEGRHPDAALLLEPRLLLPILGLAALALLPVLYQRWRRGSRRNPA